MMIRSAVALLLALAAGSSMAASFDCSKAAGFAEVSICKDGYLSGVDSILARSYKKALTEAENPDELRQLQREWLTERNQCTTQTCLDKTLGARVTFLDNYASAEKSKAYAAEEKIRQEQRAAERQAEEIATAKRTEQYNLAQELARQQRQQAAQQRQVQTVQTQPQVAPAVPSYQAPAYVTPQQQARPAVQASAEKPFFQRAWQAFWSGPAWKYTLLVGILITCWTVWRHHTETATIYTDYTDAAITNLLPASGVVVALLLRWLEMPGLVQGIAMAIGILLGIIYAVYATFKANQGALNVALVVLTKLTIISVFYAVIGMLIASLFSNTARRKGESQARAEARNRREKKQTKAQIAALAAAYTALTVWLCRRPEFTTLSECLEFDTTPQLA
jgi:uncharacterized protein